MTLMQLKKYLPAVPRQRGARLGLWYAIAAVMVAADYSMGAMIQFPITFVLPVLLAAWFDSMFHALLLAIVLPMIRLGFVIGIWTVPWTTGDAITNAAIRIVVLSLVAYLAQQAAKEYRVVMREVLMLERIMPICSFCKKIRDSNNSWQPLDSYLQTHADISISHGLCPDCLRLHYSKYTGNP